MKKFLLLSVVLLFGIVAISPSWAQPVPLKGVITYPSGIYATNEWALVDWTQFSWDITPLDST